MVYFGKVKKTACLLLLITVLLQAGGMLLVCLILQLNNYQRIEDILENSETRFEKIVLTHAQYEKARKEDNEIFLNGKLYDIKEVRLNAGSVELTAYHDTHEESLISVMENFFNRENTGNDFSSQVLKLLVSVYTLSSLQIEFTQQPVAKPFVLSDPENYLSFAGETLSPPPDSVN